MEAMDKSKTLINDLTQGSIIQKLFRFTAPMMLANTLQVCFNLVDMFFVGRYAGTSALSAVSIGGQLTTFMYIFYIGIATAGQICIAQAVGARRHGDMNGMIGNIVTLSVLTGALLMIVLPLLRPILRAINTPEDILSTTGTYLAVCTWFNIPVTLYNGLAGILRGMGDSRHPTIFISVATVVNIVLDYVFIARFRWGVAGAAWATVIGQTAAFVFALAYLYRNRAAFGFDFRPASLRPVKKYMAQLLRVGMPIAGKNAFINGSFLIINAQINHLGVVAVAVMGICQKLQSIINIIGMAMHDGTGSMVGQNFAARNMARVRQSVWCASGICVVFCIVLSALFLLFPKAIFGLFSSDPEVIAQAPAFMGVCCIIMLAFSLLSPVLGLINGVGNTKLNLYISIADSVVARLSLAMLFGYGLDMGALGFFLGNSAAGFVSVICGWIYFLSGKWERLPAIQA